MPTPLEEWRRQYPQYNDRDDDEVATFLHDRYYPNADPNEFRQYLGLAPATPPPKPTLSDRIDNQVAKVEGQPQTFVPPYSDVEEDKPGFLSNSLRLAAERGTALLGAAVRGIIGRPGDWLERHMPAGRIVMGTDWSDDDPADGKFRIRYMSADEYKSYKAQGGTAEDPFYKTIPDYLISRDFGGEDRNTAETVKQEFKQGHYAGTLGAVMKFGIEQGIKSLPDMFATMSGVWGLAAYVGARSDEMGMDRAHNKGMTEAGMREQLEALPGAIGDSLMERLGATKVFGIWGKVSPEELGTELLKQGLKNSAKRIAKRTVEGAAAEASTEAVQEGIIEYLTEKLGTDAPMSWQDALERGFWGAVAGGVGGGTMAGMSASGSEVTRSVRNAGIETDLQVEQAPDTDFNDQGEVVASRGTRQTEDMGPAPKGYFDSRLKGDVVRNNLAALASELTGDKFPSWYQASQGTEFALTPHDTQLAVRRALNGEKLGVREMRMVAHMLDHITGDTSSPTTAPYVRPVLEKARKTRRQQRTAAGNELNEALPPLSPQEESMAGELFKENEYLPGMDGEARIVDELAANLDDMGYSQEADSILQKSDTTAQAIRELEKFTAERQKLSKPPTEVTTNEQRATEIGPASEATTPAESAQTTTATDPYYRGDHRPPNPDTGAPASDLTGQGRVFPEDVYSKNGSRYYGTGNPKIDAATLKTLATVRNNPDALLEVYRAVPSAIEGEKINPGDWVTPNRTYAEEVGSSLLEGDYKVLSQKVRAGDIYTSMDQLNEFGYWPDFSTDRRTETRATPERRQDVERRARVASMTPDQIVQELYTDPLTGLHNRRAFHEDMHDAAVVASIDVDGLKGVNDTIGHDAGDAMLKAVANALQDTGLAAYHISGDEFYLLGDNEASVARAIEDAQALLAHQVVETGKGKVAGVKFSAGIGTSKASADHAMETHKTARVSAGDANPRGVMPKGGVLNMAGPRTLNYEAGNNYVGTIGQYGDLPLDANGAFQLGNGRIVRIPKNPVRRADIIRLLEQKFGTKIYQGRVKGQSRLGFYRKGIGEIRTKNHNDLEVTAHEFAHWLDDRHPWIQQLYKQYKTEMKGVSYDSQKLYEGFAEFMRLWFTQENVARENAPGFYDAWMAAMDKHPGIRDVAFDVQELMHAWYLQGARARGQDRIGKRSVPISERAGRVIRKFDRYLLQKAFDELRPFKEAERDIRGRVTKAAASGYLSLRLARGARGVMMAILHRGTINWNADGDIDFTGKGIKQVFEPVSHLMTEMQEYMIGRRAQELMEQGRENHMRPDEIKRFLEHGDEHPELKETFDEWLKFNKRMMDFYESSGILSPESRAAIEEANKNYVPFNRIMDTFAGEKVKRGGSPFMRLKGGTQNINDVFESIVGNTAHLVQMSLINRGKANFYRMIDSSDNQTAALYAVPIPKDVKPIGVDSDQVLRRIVESVGLDMKTYRMMREGFAISPAEQQLVDSIDMIAEGLQPMVTFFQYGMDPKGNVDFYWEGGKKKYYEVADPRLYEAIQHLGPRSHNLAANILGGFSNVLRRGVTLTPQFQIRNFIRDTMNAFTLSKGHIVPAAGATKALLERLYNDSHYWDYMANGGGFASMADAEGINRDRVIDNFRKASELVDRGLASFEYANRIAEFKALREKGWSARDAALAGREISTDFAMRGSSEVLRWITTAVPFLNARLQGLYRNGRELAEMQHGKVSFIGKQAFSYGLRSLVSITVPSVALYLLNKDDKRYQELPDWIRDLSWVIFTGDGEDDYVMIPKPFETGMLWGTMPERFMQYSEEHDSKELTDSVGWMFLQAFNFDIVPQAYRPWDDLAKNKNFTGAPIIPEYLQDVEPMEQYRSYTSDSMIALGRALNISPMKAEYLVRGYLSTWGIWALSLSDYLVGDISNGGVEPTKGWQDSFLLSSFVNDGPLRRTHSEDHLYELLKQTREVANTVRIISQRSPDRIEGYVSQPKKQALMSLNKALEDAAKRLREINNAMDIIQGSPDMTGEEKQAALFELRRTRNELTRAVMSNINPDMVQKLLDDIEKGQQPRAQAQ